MHITLRLLVVSGTGLAADSQHLIATVAEFNHRAVVPNVQCVARWWGDEAPDPTGASPADQLTRLLGECDLLVLLLDPSFRDASMQAIEHAPHLPPCSAWQAQGRTPKAGDGAAMSHGQAAFLAHLHTHAIVQPYGNLQELHARFVVQLKRFATARVLRDEPPWLKLELPGDPFEPLGQVRFGHLEPDTRPSPPGLDALMDAMVPQAEAPQAAGAEPPEDLPDSAPPTAPALDAPPGALVSSPAAASPLPAAPPPTSAPAARPLQPPEVPPVDAAVFCPPQVARASVFLVQVYLYPPPAAAAVAAEARHNDPGARSVARVSLPLDVPPGARVALRLEMPTLQVDEPDALLVWRGVSTAAQFEVAVPAGGAAADAIGRVRLAVDGVPVGTMRFKLQVLPAGSTVMSAEAATTQAQRYRRAFVSYSSKDRAEVLRRVQAFKIAGLSVFQDVLSLDPGERWAQALYREIDQCDVFLLFWSKAAAASPWVAKEIDYALARQGGDADRPPAIQPVPIEGPPITPPPPQLSALHFNDALLAQIAAASVPPPSAPPLPVPLTLAPDKPAP